VILIVVFFKKITASETTPLVDISVSHKMRKKKLIKSNFYQKTLETKSFYGKRRNVAEIKEKYDNMVKRI
jgi:hypothetical protein